jgi:hexosaminidase
MHPGHLCWSRRGRFGLWVCVLVLVACRAPEPPTPTPVLEVDLFNAETIDNLIPLPVSVRILEGAFTLQSTTSICVEPGTTEILAIGQYLADKLNPSTGYGLQVKVTTGAPAQGNLYLTTVGGDPALGEEGYELSITPEAVTLVAYRPAGLFRGIQTIRQLLPPSIESPKLQSEDWKIPAGSIRDYPRFEWRGVMLDVARHFFSVEDVKRYIDLIAYYKMNRFHIHLSDDQGWRIMINSWPKLAAYGGNTQVGGGVGGYYTQAEYADMVAYAQARYITVVPEIDMPGHTNAALASYADLNCGGVATTLYTGTRVGFSSLCTDKEITYTFVEDVIRELAILTPGPYIHIGGDEASSTKDDDFIRFIERVQSSVQSFGKQMIGWEDIGEAKLSNTSIIQLWNNGATLKQTRQNAKVIVSLASKTYIDMKYTDTTSLGLDWAGTIEVSDAYNWDPVTLVEGVPENAILGLEAPLWTETIQTMDQIEYMAFPRVVGYAEIGWSPSVGRNWDEYQNRLGTHGPRLSWMGVDFYPSPQVPWRPLPSR